MQPVNYQVQSNLFKAPIPASIASAAKFARTPFITVKPPWAAEEKAKSATSQLSSTIESQQSAVNKAKEAYKEAVLQYGKNSTEAKNLAKEVKTLSSDLEENKTIICIFLNYSWAVFE